MQEDSLRGKRELILFLCGQELSVSS